MSVRFLIDELTLAGVELWAEGGSLRYKAPPGALSPALKDRIKDNRPQILQHLRDQAAIAKLVERWEREQETSPSAKFALETWRKMDSIEAGLKDLLGRYYQGRKGELTALDERWKKGLTLDRKGYRNPAQEEKAFVTFGEIANKAAPIIEELSEERPDLMEGLDLTILDPGPEVEGLREAA